MFDRRTFSAVVWSGLVLCLTMVLAAAAPQAEELTAEALYRQGMQLYGQGDLRGALDVFRKVDQAQLPETERVQYLKTMQDAERQLAGKALPVALLADADAARKKGEVATASALYQAVLANEQSTDAHKQQARAGLAEINRGLAADLGKVRQSLDDVTADVLAGRWDAADARIKSIQASGVTLGWWDQQRLERQASLVAEGRAAAGAVAVAPPPASAPGAEPGPVAVTPPPATAPDDAELLKNYRNLLAQKALLEARKLEEDGQLRAAERAYERGLQIEPDSAETKAELKGGLERVQTRLAMPITGAIETRDVVRQMAIHKYDTAIARAASQLEAGNHAAATESVNEALLVLAMRQSALGTDEFNEMDTRARGLREAIARKRIEAEGRTLMDAAQQRARDEAARAADYQKKKVEEVRKLVVRAAELRRVQKYPEALMYLRQAAVIDDQDESVKAMIEMVEDAMVFNKYRQDRRLIGIETARTSAENTAALVPWSQIMVYPSDWPAISEERLRRFGGQREESEANRAVRDTLRATEVPINFDGNRLQAVIDYLRNITNLNFDPRWTVLEAAGVDKEKQVTLKLNKVPADIALKRILQEITPPGALDIITYTIVDGIVTISTEKDLAQAANSEIYDIRDILVAVPNFEPPQGGTLSDNVGGGLGGGGLGGGLGGGGLGGPSATATGLTPEELITQLKDLIYTSVARRPEDWRERGGPEAPYDLQVYNQALLIVKTTPQYHRDLVRLLAKLREERSLQISVESRFLTVTQNFLDEVGVDFDLYMDGSSRFLPFTISQDSYGMAARPSGTIPGSFGSSAFIGDADRVNRYVDATPADLTTGSLIRALDVGFGYNMLDDLQVRMLIRATQAQQRSISLSAPRITFMNGQMAYVSIQTEIAYISDLEPVSGTTGSTGGDPTIETVVEGVQLGITGTASADRRYVTITAQPRLTRVQRPFRRISVGRTASDLDGDGNPDSTDDDIDGDGVPNAIDIAPRNGDIPVVGAGPPPAEDSGNLSIEAPEMSVTEVKTTVSVPDRGTILLGGQRLVDEIEVEAGVPILSKIPILNRLTTNKSRIKDEQTLLILIKPTILIHNEIEDRLWPGAPPDKWDRFNVGRVNYSAGGGAMFTP